MKIGNYIINDVNLDINASILPEVEKILQASTSDVIFFKSITKNKKNQFVNVDGFDFILKNAKKEDFLLLNKVNSHPFDGFPYIYGFIKEDLYIGNEAIIDAILNEKINKISTVDMVIGIRENELSDKFIQTISAHTGPFYLTHYKKQTSIGGIIEAQQKSKKLVPKAKKITKKILKKIYNKTIKRFK